MIEIVSNHDKQLLRQRFFESFSNEFEFVSEELYFISLGFEKLPYCSPSVFSLFDERDFTLRFIPGIHIKQVTGSINSEFRISIYTDNHAYRIQCSASDTKHILQLISQEMNDLNCSFKQVVDFKLLKDIKLR